MSLNHAILGLLSREPLTGYDIKKIMQNTPFLYWSGNNNQIYKTVAALLDEGFVVKEVRHQAGSPSKNIYAITDAGRNELKKWLLSDTDEPFFKKHILIKLALADRLNRDELENMLASYAEAVKAQAVLAARELDQCYFAEQEFAGKILFMDLIKENILSFYTSELQWIRKVKAFVAGLPDEAFISKDVPAQKVKKEEGFAMEYRILERRGKRCLHFTGTDALIRREQDAVDIIALCAEHDTNAVVLEGNMLSDDFVNLKTGLAGAVLQKLGNYNIQAAVVIKGTHNFPARFQELVSELRAGHTFRIFAELEEAASWLFA